MTDPTRIAIDRHAIEVRIKYGTEEPYVLIDDPDLGAWQAGGVDIHGPCRIRFSQEPAFLAGGHRANVWIETDAEVTET